jgi:hypothetical protein
MEDVCIFLDIWSITFFHFGMLYQEKSGNPAGERFLPFPHISAL